MISDLKSTKFFLETEFFYLKKHVSYENFFCDVLLCLKTFVLVRLREVPEVIWPEVLNPLRKFENTGQKRCGLRGVVGTSG